MLFHSIHTLCDSAGMIRDMGSTASLVTLEEWIHDIANHRYPVVTGPMVFIFLVRSKHDIESKFNTPSTPEAGRRSILPAEPIRL